MAAAAGRLEGLMASLTRVLYGWEEEFLRRVESSGLTARQMLHLEAIAEAGNPSPSEIAARQGITKPSVTDLLGRLEAAGFIRKARSDADRREYHVHVTPKGRGFIREHRAVHGRLARLFTEALSPREVEALAAMLDAVLASALKGE
jgi:DNA-binding MarR family transcriptional regulator